MLTAETTLEQVSRARAGEAGAFDPLVQAYRRPVQALLVARLGDADLAAELCQDVLVTAWRRLGELRQPERFGAWVMQIAAHRATAELRRRRREAVAIERLASEPAPAPAGADATLVRAAHEALARLTPGAREVLTLRYGAGLSHERIAALMGITEGASQARVHRALVHARREAGAVLAAVIEGSTPSAETIMEQVYRIQSFEQVAALMTGRVHPELIGYLAEAPHTVAEVAAELSLSANEARAQVDELVRVGLVEAMDEARGRRGARYQAVAKRFEVAQDLLSHDVEHAAALLSDTLTAVTRRAEAVYAAEGVERVGIGTVTVLTWRCTPEAAQEAQRRLSACIGEIIDELGSDEGRDAVLMGCVLPQPPEKMGTDRLVQAPQPA